MTSDSESLALRTTVRELVSVWRTCADQIRTAFAQIADAETRLNTAYTLGGNRDLHVRGRFNRGDIDFTDPESSLVALARTCWSHLVDRLELKRVLSEAKWRELQRHLERGDLPPITEETVLAFAQQYMASLPELFAEKVTESFEWLRPRGQTRMAEYATNEKNATYEIGEKVLLGWIVEPAYGGGLRVRYSNDVHLSALESVFRALDGQGYRTQGYYSDLQNAINASKGGPFETVYFSGRAFKNGNLHLTFRRLDLLAHFNRIAGGQRLRSAAE